MLKQTIDKKVIQEKEETYDFLLRIFSAENVGIGLAIALALARPRWGHVFVNLIMVGLVVMLLIQIPIIFILLEMRIWKKLPQRKHKERFLEYKRMFFGHDAEFNFYYFTEVLVRMFFAPIIIIWKLQKYIFRLQYRVIVRPDRLEPISKS